jgi:hypothetical protein
MTIHTDHSTFAQHEPHVDPAPGKVWVLVEPAPARTGVSCWFLGVVDGEIRRMAGPNLPVEAIMVARPQDADTVAGLLGLPRDSWSAVQMDAPGL